MVITAAGSCQWTYRFTAIRWLLVSTVDGCCVRWLLVSKVDGCCVRWFLVSKVDGCCVRWFLVSKVDGCCVRWLLVSKVDGCCVRWFLVSKVDGCCVKVTRRRCWQFRHSETRMSERSCSSSTSGTTRQTWWHWLCLAKVSEWVRNVQHIIVKNPWCVGCTSNVQTSTF